MPATKNPRPKRETVSQSANSKTLHDILIDKELHDQFLQICKTTRQDVESKKRKHASLQQEIEQGEAQLAEFDKRTKISGDRLCGDMRALGVSLELASELRSFSARIREDCGWSFDVSCEIECGPDHAGAYVDFDSDFAIFRERVPVHFGNYLQGNNFHCHKSERSDCHISVQELSIFIVGEETWGDISPLIYKLALRDAVNGSQAAKELLVALPDVGASATGGWLFDFQQLLEDTPGSWTFRSAHNILNPVDAEVKRKQVESMLGAAKILLS